MRADNNWEDSVGKKLFDMEGELAPQAWENISRRIAPKPKRKPFWYWLPALLLFLAAPLAYFGSKNESFFRKPAGEPVISRHSAAHQSQTSSPAPAAQPFPDNSPARANVNEPEKAFPDPTANNSLAQNATQNPSQSQAAIAPGKSNVNKTILPGLAAAEEKNKPEEPLEKAPERSGKKRLNNLSGGVILAQTRPAINQNQGSGTLPKTLSDKAPKPGSQVTTVATSNTNPGTTKPENEAPVITKEMPLATVTGEKTEQVLAEITAIETPKTVVTLSSAEIPALDPGLAPVPAPADSLLAALPAEDSTRSEAAPRKATEKGNWQWGVYGAGQYAFQRVFANPADEVMILKLTNKNQLESERLGYEFGFRGYYPLKENVQLEVGFQFARLNQYLKFRTATTIADSVVLVNSGGNLSLEVSNREQEEILLFKYFFGGLYSGANVRLTNGLLLAGGLGANWLLWKNPDEKQIPIPTQSLNPYLSAGLRYQIPVSQGLSLQLGPTLQYYLRPVQKETAHYGAKPTTFGFSLGLLFK